MTATRESPIRTAHRLLRPCALALCLGLACAWMCGAPALAREAAPKRLVAACDVWPPYQTLPQGGPGPVDGFSTRVVRAVLQRMGVSLAEVQAYPWKRALQRLADGRAHVLFSANRTPGREAFARYPDEPLACSHWVVWTRAADRIEYTGPNDLRGLRLGLVAGYSYTEAFWEFVRGNVEYEAVSDDDTNFRKLAAGRVDAVVADLANGRAVLTGLGITGLVPHPEHPVKTNELFAVFNRALVPQGFVEAFSRELAAFKAGDEYRGLRRAFGLPEGD